MILTGGAAEQLQPRLHHRGVAAEVQGAAPAVVHRVRRCSGPGALERSTGRVGWSVGDRCGDLKQCTLRLFFVEIVLKKSGRNWLHSEVHGCHVSVWCSFVAIQHWI